MLGFRKLKGERLKVKGERLKVKGIFFLLLSITIFQFSLSSCEGTSFQSSVPRYPVRVIIDTDRAEFVTFKNPSATEYIILNREGYFLNGLFLRTRDVMDAYGYGGVVIYANMVGGMDAYDLACPYCAKRGTCSPCEVDGMYATCPLCGEEYDLASGTAVPTKGIANEYLLRLNLIRSGNKITVSQ